MVTLPPLMLQDIKDFPYTFQEWLRQVRSIVNGGSGGGVRFTGLDFTASNLTSLLTRNHDDLQNISGGTSGSYIHLKRALTGQKAAYDFGSVGAVSQNTTTLTVTGAQTNDKVVVTPTAILTAPLTVYGYVSAVNTVTIVCVNASAGAVAAGIKTYNVLVMEN